MARLATGVAGGVSAARVVVRRAGIVVTGAVQEGLALVRILETVMDGKTLLLVATVVQVTLTITELSSSTLSSSSFLSASGCDPPVAGGDPSPPAADRLFVPFVDDSVAAVAAAAPFISQGVLQNEP
jgi:hypothetical protein